MNALGDFLIRQISATGPITLADFMADCLLHPTLGYYTNAEVFGARGDFTTSPEISQMFGELIGLALAQCWIEQGRPPDAHLVELGPGRGTLMADALRATRSVPGFRKAMHVHLIEASEKLRDLQRQTLATENPTWSNSLHDLPDGPLFLIANEFFDALPIRQFVREENGWRERLISASDGALINALSDAAPVPALAQRLDDTRTGDVVEICPSLPGRVDEIAERISKHGGVAIIVDYGNWRSLGDTFQAVRNHDPVDPLIAPGKSDLTAHVEFETIRDCAHKAGAAATAMTLQGVLLERLGISQRAQTLAESMHDDSALQSHIAAHRRLTHPKEMGSLFKAIAIHPIGSPTPRGFTP